MTAKRENVCDKCNKVFSCISNLYRHRKNVHTKKKDRNIEDVFVCSVYHKKCFDRKSLQNHWSYNHSSKSNTRKSSICPICKRDVQFHLLTDHFNQKHGIQIDEQEYSFQNEKSFLKCEKKTKKDTSSKFVLCYTQNQKEAKLRKYICHQSGTFVSKSKGKRHLKSQGSKNMGTFCSASIRVFDYGKKLSVKFISTHIGHDCSSDLCHLNISPTKKEEIAKKLMEKVSKSCIIETILVLDDLHQRFPCAMMISNRKDTQIIDFFYDIIKDAVGVINPSFYE